MTEEVKWENDSISGTETAKVSILSNLKALVVASFTGIGDSFKSLRRERYVV